MVPNDARGKFYEAFAVGERYASPARRVTPEDIRDFCNLSGDHNPLHTDDAFAKTTIHGGVIAPGALIFSLSTGLFNALGFGDGTTIANLGMTQAYRKPVKPGDKIRVDVEVAGKRPTSTAGRGIVRFAVTTRNQRGETVSEGEWSILFAMQPNGEQVT